MTACLVCLADAPADYHVECARALFGTTEPPALAVDLARLHTLALAMVGRTSMSGVQRKISMRLNADRTTLQVATERGRYILKPQAQTFPDLPQNEHVTMRIAARVGVDVPACGLVRIADGSLAYLVSRFDRDDTGKLAQEDFCQLAEKSPKQRYEGSAELCIRLVRRYASEPVIEIGRLYRLLVASWWLGNGDLHLKNLSLLTGRDGRHRLSPAYDLLCTRLAIPDDRLALPVGGRDDNLTRRSWLDLATYARLPARAAERILTEIAAARDDAVALIARSYLPEHARASYGELVTERAQILAGAPPG
jgi:serine/threonine-protein kinase HipA